MAPQLRALYTLSFAIAVLATLFVAATLRLLAILPNGRNRIKPWRKTSVGTRVLIVLGSGGHTHEMFYLLKDLDTRKYTHRTYVVSSGDAFSAQRAVDFEKHLEEKAREKAKSEPESASLGKSVSTRQAGTAKDIGEDKNGQRQFLGPDHYDVAIVPRARKIHQPLWTTPFSALYCLWCCFPPLLTASGPILKTQSYTRNAAMDCPDLIITNGPATAVMVILASLILRFFNVKSVNSRGKCRTIYAESFARVKGLSLSGKLLSRIVDRFLVQWEELEGAGNGRAEFWGILV